MAKDTRNPFSLSFDENFDDMSISVTVRKRDGDDFVDLESETFKLEDVAEEIRNSNIPLYGLKQVLSDRCSQVDTGPDKLSAMREVMSQLNSGQWKKERVVGAPTVSAEVEALAQIKGISIPDVQRALRNYAPEQREKILGNARVKELAAQIREARTEAPTASLDDLAA